ncbi:hypothetical protein [Planctobacterium marinum]|uniref:Uncharacterized protein n=1 Tax=Planctobacterium marinum TaxID=1631968 RepID=A0AA48HXZ9_9ALTE|nr:hypothetical protein MACH26_34690 [Planctobacterium marinum]
MKTLLVAVLLLVGLTLLCDEPSFGWYAVHLDGLQMFEPFLEGLIFVIIAGALLLFGLFLAVSLVGALLLGFGAVLFSVLFIGLHMFWPILFLLLVIYLVAGGGKQTAS